MSIVLFIFAGSALGALYFALLRETASLRPLPALSALAARIVVATAFFLAAARFGAAPLLAAFAGFLVARALALRIMRRAA